MRLDHLSAETHEHICEGIKGATVAGVKVMEHIRLVASEVSKVNSSL